MGNSGTLAEWLRRTIFRDGTNLLCELPAGGTKYSGQGYPFYGYSTGASEVSRLCYRPVNEKLTKIIRVSFDPLTILVETCLYASSF